MNSRNKDEMQAEYDFRGKQGERGKYYKAMRKGYKTIIHKEDGTTAETETRPIFLDEDVREYFPDSESVNNALRGLIELVPEKRV